MVKQREFGGSESDKFTSKSNLKSRDAGFKLASKKEAHYRWIKELSAVIVEVISLEP